MFSDDTYADFVECTVQKAPQCGNCDRSNPGLIPAGNCDALSTFVTANTGCCSGDECGTQLTAFQSCKACAAGDTVPSTPAPGPSGNEDGADGVCDDTFADFVECTVQNIVECGNCDRTSPGLLPSDSCDALGTWVTANTNCCTGNECGTQLTEFETCKACSGSAGDNTPTTAPPPTEAPPTTSGADLHRNIIPIMCSFVGVVVVIFIA